MKARLISGLIVITLLASLASAQDNRTDSAMTSLQNRQSNSTVLISSRAPLSPASGDMNVYPQQMEAVLQAIAQDLSRISEAVRDGKLTQEEGEYLSVEQYYVGLLRFQLLRALHQNAKDANPGVSSPQASTAPKVLGNTVVTAAPTSSADISEQAAAYLELTPAQIAAIRAAISDQRKTTQPLADQFENNRRELNFLTSRTPLDAGKIQALAIEQGRIVEQFIVSNALLESKLYEMLTEEQKQKVGALLQIPN